MNFKKNQELTLSITGMTQEGNGVGKVEGYAIFVPLTAIGDEVLVQLVKVGKNYGYARLLHIISPSSQRLPSIDCPYFKQCGGCSFRHITYEEETTVKESFVRENFSRIGKIDTPVSPIVPSPLVNRYRNKALYPISMIDGKPRIGFYARRSHRLIPVDDCLLEPEIFSEIARFTEGFIAKNQISVYNEATGKGKIRHLYLRKGEKTGEIAAGLVINSKSLFQGEKWASVLTSLFPAVKSVFLNSNTEKSNVILGKETVFLTKEKVIFDELSGLTFQLSPTSFYQVNAQAAEKLYGIAKEEAHLSKEETLLDLYCGIGSIGLSMAREVHEVVGVEIVPEAIDNAKENAQINHIDNATFIVGDAQVAAVELLEKNLTPDIIVLDPPRKGCSKELLNTVLAFNPARIVMVSCDSATAARDTKHLANTGYTVESITPVDLFPRTTHVEMVVSMTKN